MEKVSPITDLTNIDLPQFKSGKVRHLYDLGQELLIVASDRVSAFDFILPNGIPQKGEMLTKISEFWFEKTKHLVGNHLISSTDFTEQAKPYDHILAGRSMLVKKAELIPVECVVRGYIIGSGWKDYQQTGQICGIDLPAGLQLAQELPEPIFTPASKAEQGDHDENISFQTMIEMIGEEKSHWLKNKSIELYNFGRALAKEKGIILADTKFEFGVYKDEIILIDEVLTPDSSRYWPIEDYKVGISPPSFDKQIVRDYLAETWDKNPPIPELPDHVIDRAAHRYKELYLKLV